MLRLTSFNFALQEDQSEYSPSPLFDQRKSEKSQGRKAFILPFTLFSIYAPYWLDGGDTPLSRSAHDWAAGVGRFITRRSRYMGLGQAPTSIFQECIYTWIACCFAVQQTTVW